MNEQREQGSSETSAVALVSEGVKYPAVEVQLSGQDGNAMVVIGAVRGALRAAGVPNAEIAEFTAEATGGDYDHLLQTCMRWVSVS